MMQIRRAEERGRYDYGWLDTAHTFSFNTYYDPDHMGFRALRVINEDRVQPGEGFGMHGHRDMEIITVVLEGALEHKDSIGTGSVIGPGRVQRMTAGRGIRHSEFNPSKTDPVHLYQIWIVPENEGLPPTYEERTFDPAEQRGRLRLIASHSGEDGSLTIHQDARLYLAALRPGESVRHELTPGRHAWVQVLRGGVAVNGEALKEGDGAALGQEAALTAEGDGEILLFDLA
ncbi:MAG TPA: pirin family protein [Gemmataceae bacterium]|nr:pirin family protein [Gemmataceae bacterium]